MEINGYELEGIVHMRADGPMWRSRTPEDKCVLITLHTPDDARRHEDRWKAWAGIESDNVVTLCDVICHEDGRWALVQEEILGDSLAYLLESNAPLLKTHAQAIIDGLTNALKALEQAGITHGDLAPTNILVTQDATPVIIDMIGPLSETEENGTPGWSTARDQNEPMSSQVHATAHTPLSDRQALDTIIHAIKQIAPQAQAPANERDPGQRLRLHSALPQTERRPTLTQNVTKALAQRSAHRNTQSHPNAYPPASTRAAQRPPRQRVRAHAAKARPHNNKQTASRKIAVNGALLTLICATALYAGSAASNNTGQGGSLVESVTTLLASSPADATPLHTPEEHSATNESDATASPANDNGANAGDSKTTTPQQRATTAQTSSGKHTGQTNSSATRPVLSNTNTHASCPNETELLQRAQIVLAIRDNAFNTANAHGLEAYVADNILREDSSMIEQMNASNQRITGFSTLIDGSDMGECTDDTVTLTAKLSASTYTLCEKDECQDMPASTEKSHVKLIFSLPQLLLKDVQPASEAS